jgi:VanZ family protein
MKSDFNKAISALWWAMTVAWAALIFYFSTRTFSPDFTRGLLAWTLHLIHLHVSSRTFGLLHAILRKLAHVVEYGIFALLIYGRPGEKERELWRPRRAIFCILGAAAYSLTDEFHQLFVPGRHSSLLDCGLDTLGAALAMLVPYAQERISFLRSNKTFPEGSCHVNPSVPTESDVES